MWFGAYKQFDYTTIAYTFFLMTIILSTPAHKIVNLQVALNENDSLPWRNPCSTNH